MPLQISISPTRRMVSSPSGIDKKAAAAAVVVVVAVLVYFIGFNIHFSEDDHHSTLARWVESSYGESSVKMSLTTKSRALTRPCAVQSVVRILSRVFVLLRFQRNFWGQGRHFILTTHAGS